MQETKFGGNKGRARSGSTRKAGSNAGIGLNTQLTGIKKLKYKRGSILGSDEDRNYSSLYSEADQISEGLESFFDDIEERKKKYGVKKIAFKNLTKTIRKRFHDSSDSFKTDKSLAEMHQQSRLLLSEDKSRSLDRSQPEVLSLKKKRQSSLIMRRSNSRPEKEHLRDSSGHFDLLKPSS